MLRWAALAVSLVAVAVVLWWELPAKTEVYGVEEVGEGGAVRVYVTDADGRRVSPWHDIPLLSRGGGQGDMLHHFVCEIPRYTQRKMEISTLLEGNPIIHDSGRLLRFGPGMPVNYGALSQTFEDPSVTHDTGYPGDGDPIDVVSVDNRPCSHVGVVQRVRVLGALALIDDGETDYKLAVVSETDALFDSLHDIGDVERELPGLLAALRFYFKNYKTITKNITNAFAFGGEWRDRSYALAQVADTHKSWRRYRETRRKRRRKEL